MQPCSLAPEKKNKGKDSVYPTSAYRCTHGLPVSLSLSLAQAQHVHKHVHTNICTLCLSSRRQKGRAPKNKNPKERNPESENKRERENKRGSSLGKFGISGGCRGEEGTREGGEQTYKRRGSRDFRGERASERERKRERHRDGATNSRNPPRGAPPLPRSFSSPMREDFSKARARRRQHRSTRREYTRDEREK